VLSACHASPAGLRVAWSPTLGYARPDPEVLRICEAAARRFEDLGCSVEQVDDVFERDPADLWTAEFYAGVGTRLRSIIETQGDILDPGVAVVLKAALGQEMRDYYTKVFARYALRDRIHAFFERFDILLSPVLPVTSLDTGVDIPAHLPDRNLVSWVFYTYPFNLTGNPAASICAGIAADGMPVGLQVVGRGYGEYDVVRAAAAFERLNEPGYNLRRFES
jgi:aspartyl-tRNA(Asn)/glutamyl-tRNA(Gln) amidotransferase subunit A